MSGFLFGNTKSYKGLLSWCFSKDGFAYGLLWLLRALIAFNVVSMLYKSPPGLTKQVLGYLSVLLLMYGSFAYNRKSKETIQCLPFMDALKTRESLKIMREMDVALCVLLVVGFIGGTTGFMIEVTVVLAMVSTLLSFNILAISKQGYEHIKCGFAIGYQEPCYIPGTRMLNEQFANTYTSLASRYTGRDFSETYSDSEDDTECSGEANEEDEEPDSEGDLFGDGQESDTESKDSGKGPWY